MDEAMEEVVRGRDFANQLRQILQLGDGDGDGDSDVAVMKKNHAHHIHLLNNILNSFNSTLFLLNKHHNQNQNQIKDFSFMTKSEEDSQDSCKTTTSGRGCYKRRKSTETWEKVSESQTDDGHQWRKYGQKKILTSKYKRNYYRCSHKFEQRCEATEQVQRIQEKPPLYKSTYYTHHTCKYLPNPADIIFDPPHQHNTNSSILLCFNNTFPTPTKQDCPFLSSSSSSFSCKEELVIPSPNNSMDIQQLNPAVHQPSLDDNTPPPSPPLLSTLQFHDDDILYGLFYQDSVHHHDDDFFHPFLGFS